MLTENDAVFSEMLRNWFRDNTTMLFYFLFFLYIETNRKAIYIQQTSLSYNESNCKRWAICLKRQNYKQISNNILKRKKEETTTKNISLWHNSQCSCNWMARTNRKKKKELTTIEKKVHWYTHIYKYDQNYV